jgi:hypothetical protein
MILDGHENMPISVVQSERSRLMSLRTRRGLAANFEEMIELSTHPQKLQPRGARPLYHVTVVAAVTAELTEIVRLLRTEPTAARGVARAERVIADGTSPLYGLNYDALRSELRRVISQLSA